MQSTKLSLNQKAVRLLGTHEWGRRKVFGIGIDLVLHRHHRRGNGIKDDLRSFPKWQRKLSVRQIAGYMSQKDVALLYSSLTAKAEEELEHCDLDRFGGCRWH